MRSGGYLPISPTPKGESAGEAFFIGVNMLTQQRLKELFNYDPLSGKLTSKYGNVCGESSKSGYYISVNVEGKTYKAHRLAWLYMYGEFPNGLIDHKNEDKTDNRISNLRIASDSTNQHNRFKSKEHKLLGAFFHKPSGKWRASIMVNKQRINLGTFSTEIEAHNTYMEAKRIYHADAY